MKTRVPSMYGRLAATTIGLCLLAAAPAAMAQILTFMFIDGIPGEATLDDKRNWIELTGYSQSFGTANCSRAVANKRIDRASPPLISRAAANQLIPTVLVTMRKAGEAQRDFFVATLTQVLVDRIEIADQGDQLLERVVLAPQSITIQYFPQDPKGGPAGSPVTASVACGPVRRN
jgi:type VI protein secretion system component Hcp